LAGVSQGLVGPVRLGVIATKTGIPKTSLHRYLATDSISDRA
jgi:DNA-binding IclR family transcriptional regulator